MNRSIAVIAVQVLSHLQSHVEITALFAFTLFIWIFSLVTGVRIVRELWNQFLLNIIQKKVTRLFIVAQYAKVNQEIS